MNIPEVLVPTSTVACEGQNPASRHPRVYLNLEKTGHAICPYCSCRYLYQS